MPIYEYACKSCGERLEVTQSFTDEPLTACPACGGSLRKVFGSISISFKGSGFYRTDARPAAAKAERSEKDGKAEKGAKGEKAGSAEKGEKAGSAEKGDKAKTESTAKPDVGPSSSSGARVSDSAKVKSA